MLNIDALNVEIIARIARVPRESIFRLFRLVDLSRPIAAYAPSGETGLEPTASACASPWTRFATSLVYYLLFDIGDNQRLLIVEDDNGLAFGFFGKGGCN
jgi:hypothetical protein